MRKLCYRALLLVLLLTPWTATPAQSSQKSFSFGVVPQESPTRLATVWTPLLSYLSHKTGYTFTFQTAKDISSFNKQFKDSAFDIAYINPFVYATDKSGNYKVFAKEKDIRLRGIIVTAKNSSYNTIVSLHNTTMAVPDPDSFAATLLPLTYLEKAGVSVTLKNARSHESVYRAVAKGFYPGGGGIIKTLEKADPAIQDQLQILWTSPPYTPHPFAAHARIPQEVVAKLLAAMSTMHLDPQGKAILEAIPLKGIESGEDREYDEIRALKNLSTHIQ